MNSFFRFMASSAGRWTRIIVGAILVYWGYFSLGGTTGIIVAIVGLVPLLAGAFDVCVFAPIFGKPFGGPDLRKNVK